MHVTHTIYCEKCNKAESGFWPTPNLFRFHNESDVQNAKIVYFVATQRGAFMRIPSRLMPSNNVIIHTKTNSNNRHSLGLCIEIFSDAQSFTFGRTADNNSDKTAKNYYGERQFPREIQQHREKKWKDYRSMSTKIQCRTANGITIRLVQFQQRVQAFSINIEFAFVS